MEIESIHPGIKVAEIEISFKPLIKPSQLPKIQNCEDAYSIFMEKWDASKIELVEEFKALFLNRAHRVIGIGTLSTGGLTSTIIDSRILFAAALKLAATGIILAHNHPSGHLQPSDSDKHVTKNIEEAGKFLGITMLDHLIVSKEGYYSFTNAGAF